MDGEAIGLQPYLILRWLHNSPAVEEGSQLGAIRQIENFSMEKLIP